MNTVVSLLTLFLFFGAILAQQLDYKVSFADWMQKHNKAYSVGEFSGRFAKFSANLDYVTKWNAEDNGVVLGMNKFADLSLEEYRSTMLGLRPRPRAAITDLNEPLLPADPVVDWRTKGAVTDIKDQGQCGSCWSFSATGSIEGAWQIAGHDLVSLSEQNLMDCSTSFGNEGCSGGLMDSAFDYVIANHGLDTEVSYPYTAKNGNACKYSATDSAINITAYKDVPQKNETVLASFVSNYGPVSVGIDAAHTSFQLYQSGVYAEPLCSQTQLDHGVLVVGYGHDDVSGSDYWIVKNSWGTVWGQSGYMWMAKDTNNKCGIATLASIPFVPAPAV